MSSPFIQKYLLIRNWSWLRMLPYSSPSSGKTKEENMIPIEKCPSSISKTQRLCYSQKKSFMDRGNSLDEEPILLGPTFLLKTKIHLGFAVDSIIVSLGSRLGRSSWLIRRRSFRQSSVHKEEPASHWSQRRGTYNPFPLSA